MPICLDINGRNVVKRVHMFSTDQSEESRLQPAFEMTLDRNFSADSSAVNKQKKSEETSGSSLRFKNLFGSGKTEGPKTNLLSKIVCYRSNIFQAILKFGHL